MKKVVISTLVALVGLTTSGCATGAFIKAEHPPGSDGAFYALPKALWPIDVSREGCDLKVTPPATPTYIGDPNNQYRLQIDHHWLSSETLKVGTDENGLLTTVNGTGEDQLPAALNKVLDLVAAAYGVPPKGAPTGPQTDGQREKLKCEESKELDFVASLIVDPTLERQDEANRLLDGTHVTLSTKPLYPTGSDGKDKLVDCSKVVCFRAARPYEITFVQRGKGLVPQTRRLVVLAPDPSSTMSVHLDRQLLSKADIKLTFSNGMMTSYDTSKNSEALSLLQVPLDIASAILGLPSQIATIKVTNYGDDQKVLDAYSALLNSQAAMITAQQNLAQAQQKKPTETPGEGK